jgi:hypothetical protein
MNLAYIDTNFQRLLLKCEELAEKQELDNWRFEKVYFDASIYALLFVLKIYYYYF